MAEPARKYRPEIQPEIRPNLHAVPGGGESTPERGNLSAAPDLKQQEQDTGAQAKSDRHLRLVDPTDDVKAQEQSGEWNTNVSAKASDRPQSRWTRVKRSAKKGAPIGGVIGIFTCLGIMSGLLSPALLIVHFKEAMTDKFNDQLAAMDVRSTAILKKKISKDVTRGACSPIKIRCKYQSMSNRQVKRLEKAGINVNGDSRTITGRTKPTSFEFEGRRITAGQLLGEAKRDPSLRRAIQKGYNPRFYAFSDKVATKVRTTLGLKRSKNITPSSDEEKMRQQLTENASGEADTGSGAKYTKQDPDCTGPDCRYVSPDSPAGETVSQDEARRINNAIDEIEARKGLADAAGKTALKSGLKGALTSTAFGLGAVDTACTAWNIIRVATFAAKVYGQRQLIRYSYQFMNTADAIKAGDATPEEVSFLGKILTSINSEGRAAADSDGYKYAAFGDVFQPKEFDTEAEGSGDNKQLTDAAVDKNALANETSKYVNGQIIPDNLFAGLVRFFERGGKGGSTEAIDDSCKFIKSWEGQAIVFGTAIAGAVVGFFTGGASVSVGAVAQVAVTISISVAMAVITPKLVDMAKGELITGDENGNEAGNAITSGMGGYNAQASQGRGLAVLEKDDAVSYNNLTNQVAAQYDETEKLELSPFDASSNKTFVGNMVSRLIPYSSKMSSLNHNLPSAMSLVSSSLSPSVFSNASAEGFKAEEFESCPDQEYESRDLAADPFCNLRYGLSTEALEIDPETVLDYMIDGGYISEDMESTDVGDEAYKDSLNGENSDKYKEFIADCIDRKKSIGDDIEGGSSGDECIQGGSKDSERNMMFRLFYLDSSINEGMDNGPHTTGTGDSVNTDGTGGDFTIASFNILHTGPDPHERLWRERMGRSLETLTQNGVQVAGLQEVRPPQNALLQNNRVNNVYDIWPKDTNGGEGFSPNPVIWDRSKFEMVQGSGELRKIHYQNTLLKHLVLVKLVILDDSGNKTDQEIYVASTHDPGPVRRGGSPAARAANARIYKELYAEKASEGIPMFVVGDFNSNNDGYCILSGPNVDIINAYDASRNPPLNGQCPSKNKVGIDHIYLTKDSAISASGFKKIEKEYNGNGSRAGGNNGADHPTIIASITIEGEDDDGTNPGGRIDGDDYARECSRYLSSGDCTGECVGFVKFRLVKHGVIDAISLGNGGAVTSTLRGLGFRVNTTPAVNSVMSLKHNSVGHTAMVSKVNGDGSIVVEEYNWPGGHVYGTRTISKATLDRYRALGIIDFAHTETRYR